MKKVTKKLERRIMKEFAFIMGIVSEGLGSQYGVIVGTKTKFQISPKIEVKSGGEYGH